MRPIKQLLVAILLLCGFQVAHAQNISVSAGTDIPYQHYVGATLELERIDVAYRTGILLPPYSDAILQMLDAFGTDELYINLLETAYDFGWMNTVGGYYKFGEEKKWYAGLELRADYLTAGDTPAELVESAIGQPLPEISIAGRVIEVEARLGLRLYAVGLRGGRTIDLGASGHHALRAEFSFSKYLDTQSNLYLNNQQLRILNEALDDILWEDVFKQYGYVGGFGVAYVYRF